MHAARHHGVHAVGVTLSRTQAELRAQARCAEAGLGDRVEIRVQDYRDVDDGPFDAISSIGMFEHVGLGASSTSTSRVCYALLRAGRPAAQPRHQPSRAGQAPAAVQPRRGFIDRYVFPDGELHEVGTVVSRDPAGGVRGAARREPARALRAHAAAAGSRNLEADWDDAVAEVGRRRGPGCGASTWPASAVGFEHGGNQMHQVLATRDRPTARSGMPWRPDWH